MFCAVWYQLYNLRNVKHPWRSVTFSKSNTPSWIFFTFLNCANITKSRTASHYKYKHSKLNCMRVNWLICLVINMTKANKVVVFRIKSLKNIYMGKGLKI